jgi:hypothetical protein
MSRPIHSLPRTALRILMAWLLALQPMTAAYAAVATAQSPLVMELCHGGPAPDQGVPAQTDHSGQCCLTCVPASAPPPAAQAEVFVPSSFSIKPAEQPEAVSVARAGLGPQSARAPPL